MNQIMETSGSAASRLGRALWSSIVFVGALVSLAQAQLTNPGFEQSGGALSGWTTFNNVGPNVVVSTTTPRSGARCAKVFGGYNGNPDYSGLVQNVPAGGGQFWQVNAHVRHNAGDSLVGTNNRLHLKIEYYRVPNGNYGSADMLSENEPQVLNANTPTNSWIASTFSALAPAGTVEARLVFVFTQNGNAGGAALIDDVTFSPVAPPPLTTWDSIWSDEFVSCHGFQAETFSAVLCEGGASCIWSFSSQPTHRDHDGG